MNVASTSRGEYHLESSWEIQSRSTWQEYADTIRSRLPSDYEELRRVKAESVLFHKPLDGDSMTVEIKRISARSPLRVRITFRASAGGENRTSDTGRVFKLAIDRPAVYFDTHGNMKINDKQAVAALAALAQESRLQAFRLLVRHGKDGLPAGEIANALGVPPATLSFHLSQLAQGGLIDSRRNGRSIIYFINVCGVRALMAYLTEDCCGGRAELCLPGNEDEPCRDNSACRRKKGKKK